MDPNVTLHLIRVELASHHEHGNANVDALVQHVQALDDWLTNGGFRPTHWQTFHWRTRLVGRDDATHPRELPDPADEAAYARRLTGTAALNPDELEELEELLEPVGWDERVVPQRPADEVAARRAARENT